MVSKRQAMPEDIKIGSWLSAALEDSKVCEEMKADINDWFKSIRFQQGEQMNRYAEAIRIISHEDVDYKKLCVEIAAQNPGVIVSAAKRLQFTVTPAWKESCAEMMRNRHIVEAVRLYRSNTKATLKEAREACEAMVR